MSSDPDLSDLDRIDPKQVDRLPPFWRRVYRALRKLKEAEDGR